VDYRPRAGGRSKVSGSFSGTMRAAAKILATIARHAWAGAAAAVGATGDEPGRA